jgi:predicted nucleic acid-binding protein
MGKREKIILLDADVIIHFNKAGHLLTLTKIFPKRLYILDVVIQELSKHSNTKEIIDNFLNFGIATVMPFPPDGQMKKEFAFLRRHRGAGESACMAVARFNEHIIASSNLKDIEAYCEQYNIEYLTTMDFLSEALSGGIMNEAECDEFIYDVVSKGSKLPCTTIKEYNEMKERLID